MRTLLSAVVLAALTFSAACFGAEQTKIVPVGRGAYSVEAPDDWSGPPNAPYLSVTLSDKLISKCALSLAAPNPVLHSGQLISMELATLSKGGVDAEIITGVMDRKNGMVRLRVHFAAPLDDKEALVGLMHVVTVGDFSIMMIATAPDSLFDAFIEKAEAVMESIQVDVDELEKNRGEYVEIGDRWREDMLKELLGNNYRNIKMYERMVEYIDGIEPFELPEEQEENKAG